MSPSVLIYPQFQERLYGLVSAKYDLMNPGPKTPSEAFSAEERAKVTALVTTGGQHNTRNFLEELPNLKLITCYGTGYDGVDRAYAKEKGIVVCNSPGANAAAVADQAIALMLAVMRGIPSADAFVRSGQWSMAGRSYLTAAEGLTNTKVGVYGMGEIGEKIARRMAAFESDVHYFSRRKLDHLPFTYHSTLESLVDWCDILHIAVRAGADNRHIINQAMFKRLGTNGFVINVSRGLVIDEEALITALKDNIIAGAGLDVFQNEPNVRPELFALPNLVMAPHQGGDTLQAHTAMQDCIMSNLDAFFGGKPIPYPVALV
jgi:hydroxypyruvate reductase